MQRSLIAGMLTCVGAVCALPTLAQHTAGDLTKELDRLTVGVEVWPGYDPQAIPLAVYDGEQTYFFRHPSPPEDSVAIELDGMSVFVMEGRHPAIVANSSTEIGGITTATMLLDRIDKNRSLTDLAAIAAHEAFHVFQSARQPGWGANEADLFIYPVDDSGLLALRRLETEALRRALEENDAELSTCWARKAIELRHERYEQMPEQFAAYERGTELNEGIASYVEAKVAGRPTVTIPEGGFGATDVRIRCYATGTALGLLLDRFSPGWPASFVQEDSPTLDETLQDVLGHADAENCVFFTDGELTEIRRTAEQAIEQVAMDRASDRASFDETPGWRVRVEAADGRPLWLQGFDPLNVRQVSGGILHARFLRLGNEAGDIDIMDSEHADLAALTIGAGAHPLFNGVRRVEIVGLSEPEIETANGSVTLSAQGLTLEFRSAEMDRDADSVVIRLE